jgi:hypothetical protein
VVLTADGILARSTRRRQTLTGWNTAYIGANRCTLPLDVKPPADDALHPMAFLVEKGPGAVTRPHFHQADQFQVVVAGRGMLGDHDFCDGAVHYTDAYSAYGPIVAGKSGIWWFTLRNRWDPGARYMPAEREVLNAARDRHRHWELTTEAMPAALIGELCEATAISCRAVLEAEDGLAGWRYRIPPCTAIAGRAPSAGGGQFWLVLAGDAVVDGGDPLPAKFLRLCRPGGSRLCRRLRPCRRRIAVPAIPPPGAGLKPPATAASAPALVGVVRGSEPVVSPIAIQRREPCPQARSRLEARIHHSRCEEPQVAGPTLSLEKLGPRFSPVLVETIKAPRRTAIEGEFFGRRASSGDALERVPQRRVAGSHVVDGKIALEIAPFGAE